MGFLSGVGAVAAACFIRVSLMAVHEDLIRFRLLKCEERHGRVRRDVHTRVIVCMSILYRNKPTIFSSRKASSTPFALSRVVTQQPPHNQQTHSKSSPVAVPVPIHRGSCLYGSFPSKQSYSRRRGAQGGRPSEPRTRSLLQSDRSLKSFQRRVKPLEAE